MTYCEPNLPDQRQHHFLFHIFRMDKEENPMPTARAEILMKLLRSIFTDNANNGEKN